MTAWWRKACDRATNLGLTIGELTRRVHGAIDDRRMVKLALDLEETLQLDIGLRRPRRSRKLFRPIQTRET